MFQLYKRVRHFEILYKKNQDNIQNIKSVGEIASGIKNLFSEPNENKTLGETLVKTKTSKIPRLRQRLSVPVPEKTPKETHEPKEEPTEEPKEPRDFTKLKNLYDGVVSAKKMYDTFYDAKKII